MSYPGRVLLAVSAAALAWLAWLLRDVVVLVFGGLVFATVLGVAARLLAKATGLPRRWSVAVCVLLGVLAAMALGWVVGGALAEQAAALRERMPQALQRLSEWLASQPAGPRLLELWTDLAEGGVPWSRMAGAAGFTLGALGSFALMLLLGVFFAAEPDLYRDGAVRLLPRAQRPGVADALRACGTALEGWLKGQAISMLFVGAATGLGLFLLEVPLALILGLLSGLLAFVPFFGPIGSGVLAVLVAFSEGPSVALYVGGLMLLIQQVEGQLLMPLVQRWTVQLPPVLGLVSVVVFGGLFGLAGVLFATPLMVVLMVLVRKLYVEGVLEREPAGA